MATATLTVTTTDKFDLAVWVYDLNAPGQPEVLKGKLNKDTLPPLTVRLQEDGTGNVSYHWAAEEIAVKHPRHDTGVVPAPQVAVAPVAPLTLNIYLTGTGKPLPYMFRPYP